MQWLLQGLIKTNDRSNKLLYIIEIIYHLNEEAISVEILW